MELLEGCLEGDERAISIGSKLSIMEQVCSPTPDHKLIHRASSPPTSSWKNRTRQSARLAVGKESISGGLFLGTLNYMSPEQIAAERSLRRTCFLRHQFYQLAGALSLLSVERPPGSAPCFSESPSFDFGDVRRAWSSSRIAREDPHAVANARFKNAVALCRMTSASPGAPPVPRGAWVMWSPVRCVIWRG